MNKPRYINAGGRLIDLNIPKVMGIINITPDSFYSGSRISGAEATVAAVGRMIADGADIIDIGGYSSRPGAPELPAEEEEKRVLPAIKLIRNEFPETVISVDTYRAAIAEKAVVEYGVHIVNDISGGDADPEMFKVISKTKVPYIMMHMQGRPGTMQDAPQYNDVVSDILKYFGERIFKLRSAGVSDIIIDPGFGFGKTTEHNFDILHRLEDFAIAGLPLLVGLSRKTMIWKTLGITPEDALAGTIALNTAALMKGADIVRVHDVKEAIQAVKLVCRIKNL
ncbi:MAG: dihydropteroate synthase [Bacteroidales bacterium]|nr:dihydropteroate synthase [Bacteroidales bacterium]